MSSAADVRKLYYVTERLGPSRSLTPEGFLLCVGVPLARTGEMVYGPGETPIQGERVVITRTPEEVFRPETVASFNGKPVTRDHPPIPEDDSWPVTAENWKIYAVGVVLNPRREGDLLVGDLLITDAEAIKAIQEDDASEVSCGYDAEYAETGTARGEQRNIVGNHLALVEKGRCGPRCAIGDKKTVDSQRCHCQNSKAGVAGDKSQRRRKHMNVADTIRGLVKSIRDAVKTKDEGKIEEALSTAEKAGDEMPEGGGSLIQHIHAGGAPAGDRKYSDEDLDGKFKDYDDKHTANDAAHQQLQAKDADLEGRVKKMEDDVAKLVAAGPREEEDHDIEGNLEFEAPDDVTGDQARKAKDSVYLENPYQQTLAVAEILSPGITAPTFTRDAKPKDTYTAMCDLRRRAIVSAVKDATHGEQLQNALNEIRGRKTTDADIKDPKKIGCRQVRDVFFALGALKKQLNNAPVTGGGRIADSAPAVKSLAEYNKANKTRYGVQ